MSLDRPQQNDTAWTSKIPCIIQKNIKRSERSYVTAKIFDAFKQEKTVFLILDTSDISTKNHICFMQTHNLNSCEIFYFDIEKMQHGNIKATTVQNRKAFLFLAKYKQKNSDNLEKIKNYSEKMKTLPRLEKVELANWLYDNTLLNRNLISIFSGLYASEVKKIENDELKPYRVPESPMFCRFIDKQGFDLLLKSSNCLQLVL